VSNLIKSYHSKERIFQTLWLAERCGINTIQTNPSLSKVIHEYWTRKIGNIQFISDCSFRGDAMTGIKISVDHGAQACYIQGGIADKWVKQGKLDEFDKALTLIRQNNLPAGIGAHHIETIQTCVEMGLKPDFWMKTLHQDNYWSAHPAENRQPFEVVSGRNADHNQQHDNMWCIDPAETIEYMKELDAPWIAFKTLAAGALKPQEGFRYAFESGADFVCAGMYDFQLVDDVNIACDILADELKRERPWMA
jgi:hypothetical protein